MDELKQSRLSVAFHLAAAIAVGCVSWFLSLTYTKWISAAIGLAVLAALGYMLNRRWKVSWRWLSGNGMFVYLFVWAVAWILLFNMGAP